MSFAQAQIMGEEHPQMSRRESQPDLRNLCYQMEHLQLSFSRTIPRQHPPLAPTAAVVSK